MTGTVLSEKNPLLKQVRRAIARGSLTEDGFAIAESFHLLEEALKSDCEIGAVIASESVKTAVAAHVRGLKRTRVVAVSDAVFEQLASTEHTQGVIALVRPPVWTLDQLLRGRSLVVVLDGVQDPGNAGAIVRACEAFGGTGTAFLKGSVSPYNPKSLRASAGSIFRLPVVAAADQDLLLAALDHKRVGLYAAVPTLNVTSSLSAPKSITEVNFSERCAIVIGSEGRGVGPRLLDRSTPVRIPTNGVESLNAAVAAGILLYEARCQRAVNEAGRQRASS
jgi:TrmH family RNA methyltransferase